MKHRMLAIALLLITSNAIYAEDLSHDAGHACIIGGGVAAAATAFTLYSMVAFGATTVPVTVPTATAIMIGNTIFACGVGTFGTMLIYGAHSLYINLAGREPPPKAAH
jgi:hypothetical protein